MRTADDGQAARGYRAATEFQRDGRLIDEDAPTQWLRVFRDGQGSLRAGLYESEKPDINDDWAHGEPLTDRADELLVERHAGGDPRFAVDALAGIAHRRLAGDKSRPLNVQVPARLEPWVVRGRMGVTDNVRVIVMATRAETALMVAALAAANDAVRAEHTYRLK